MTEGLDIASYVILPIIGFLGMYSGGYWGIGCSWLIVPVMLFLDSTPMEAAGVALLQMTFSSFVPVAKTARDLGWGKNSIGRNILIPLSLSCLVFAILGTKLNAFVYERMGGTAFNAMFAFVMLLFGINSLLAKPKNTNTSLEEVHPRDSVTAFLSGTWVGLLGALFGISGGMFIRPVLIQKFKFPETVTGPSVRFVQLTTSCVGGLSYLFVHGTFNPKILLSLSLIVIGGSIGFSHGVKLHKTVCDNGYASHVNKSFSLVALIVMTSLMLKLFDYTNAAKVVMTTIAVLLFIYLYTFGKFTENHKRELP